jgi:hypothetical protein
MYHYITPVQSIYERFNSSGPKQSNQRFNRFLTVGPVNHRTEGLTGSMSDPVLITWAEAKKKKNGSTGEAEPCQTAPMSPSRKTAFPPFRRERSICSESTIKLVVVVVSLLVFPSSASVTSNLHKAAPPLARLWCDSRNA